MADTSASTASEVPPRSRALRRRMLILLCFFALYAAFCTFLAWNTVRPKNRPLAASPAHYNLAFEDVRFTSADGTRLSGWLIPSATKPAGVVVLCHGVDSTREAMLWKAVMLNRNGFVTLLFDFRGRGESAPALCTIGYREVEDVQTAIQFVKARAELRELPLGLFGESQGGAVALMAAARSPEVRAVVAESPFARLDNAVGNHFRMAFGAAGPLVGVPVRWIGEGFIRRRCCDVSPVDEIPRISPRPLLLIQDGADRLCPPEETAALMAAAKEPKELWTVPNADHIQAEDVAPKELEQRVPAFFRRAFRAAE